MQQIHLVLNAAVYKTRQHCKICKKFQETALFIITEPPRACIVFVQTLEQKQLLPREENKGLYTKK